MKRLELSDGFKAIDMIDDDVNKITRNVRFELGSSCYDKVCNDVRYKIASIADIEGIAYEQHGKNAH